MTVWIDTDLCNGCKRCVKACPYGAVEVQDGKAHILAHCTSCGACIEVCKQQAIHTDIEPKTIPDFSDREGVWVFAEQRDGVLSPVSFELLGQAQSLSEDLGQEVSAVLIGNQVADLVPPLFDYGADQVYFTRHKALHAYRTLSYTKVMESLITAYKPNILLMGATHIGRDLAPRLSRRVGVGLTADCTALSIDPEEGVLLQTRPAFGGNVMATIANRYSRPQMATVRPGVMEAVKKGSTKKKVIKHKVSLTEKEIGSKVLEAFKEKKKGVSLTDAKVIVAGGRGVGSETGMKSLFGLAKALGGEVAGTRIIVEEGWLPVEQQVGQTGQTVRPEIYIACGISGAIQHRAGMLGSRYVIAINKDPGAPIFKVADWGIVGDLHQVVPQLTKSVSKAQSK